jgi:hypothetical protein
MKASNILFLLGLVMLIFFWPGGVLLILVAIILWAIAKGQPKPMPTAICESCGNPIARTANICPTCSVKLIPTEGPLAPKKLVLPVDPVVARRSTIIALVVAGVAIITLIVWVAPALNR